MTPKTEGKITQQAILRADGSIDQEMIALRVPERNITVAYVRARDADFFEWAFNNASALAAAQKAVAHG